MPQIAIRCGRFYVYANPGVAADLAYARDNHAARAAVLLSGFQQLYDIEDRAKDFPVDDRKALRQAEAKPIWERI